MNSPVVGNIWKDEAGNIWQVFDVSYVVEDILDCDDVAALNEKYAKRGHVDNLFINNNFYDVEEVV